MTFEVVALLPPNAEADPDFDFTELRIIRHPNGEFTIVDPNSHTAVARLTVDETLSAIARYLFHPDKQMHFGRPIYEVISGLRDSRTWSSTRVVDMALETILREIDEHPNFPTPPLAFLGRRN